MGCGFAQVRAYDGRDPEKTILVSVNGRIYNVWRVRLPTVSYTHLTLPTKRIV